MFDVSRMFGYLAWDDFQYPHSSFTVTPSSMSLDQLERHIKKILNHVDEIERLVRLVGDDPEYYARRIRSEADDIESLAKKARKTVGGMRSA